MTPSLHNRGDVDKVGIDFCAVFAIIYRMKEYEAHGETRGRIRSYEHQAWTNMIQRCTNAKRKDFKYYGGRGITVSDEWRNSFRAFAAHMGKRPPRTSLDRIDNSKGYQSGNCRWATKEQQMQNTRHTRLIEYKGEKLGLNAWAQRLGLNKESLRVRLKKFPVEEAFTRTIKKDHRRLKAELNLI